MSGSGVRVTRTTHVLRPDAGRVLAKPHLPGEEIGAAGSARAALLMERILALPEPEAARTLAGVLAGFSARHHGFEQILERHFERVARYVAPGTILSRERRLLIGAYFTNEFSVEAAALFNPSMVLAPDQRGVPADHARFVMSLRAVGEGHTSSIEFRSGTIDAAGALTFDPQGDKLVAGRRTAGSVQLRLRFPAARSLQ